MHKAKTRVPQLDEISDRSDTSEQEIEDYQRELKETMISYYVDNITSLWMSAIVWPLMLIVPLALSAPYSFMKYDEWIPAGWYEYDASKNDSPKPLGLVLGILSVLTGQIAILISFFLFKYGYLSNGKEPIPVQKIGARKYSYWEGVKTHYGQPEGFCLLLVYLAVTWMFNILPNSYYDFGGTVQWGNLFLCLVIQDGIQFTVHRLEHSISPVFYQLSHKPHHRFTNPRLFDAFNGSLLDTLFMVVIPLFFTANIMRNVNVWTYMAFGSSYASWLTLIHSEYTYPWDAYFRQLGLGTAADHHVHHKFFKYNYGHLFMWFDKLCGTYRDPLEFAPRVFNSEI